ncbi:uncharacterized mitochondrial protein-like protein [Tanacetum coccineum]
MAFLFFNKHSSINNRYKREGQEEEQVFMDELERLKKQEKEAYEEAETLRKKFETLVIQEGAAKTSSTNIFSTVSTPANASSTNLVNTVTIPVILAQMDTEEEPLIKLSFQSGKHEISILVQVYVDDIIFRSTKQSWCDEFEALMKSRFQMSSMGELTFFLGLQISDYAGSQNLDRKSQQELSISGRRSFLLAMQKAGPLWLLQLQEAEYVLAASCCGKVL